MANGIGRTMADAAKRHEKGAVIMVELPSDEYSEAIYPAVRALTELGMDGIYVSFNRPFKNISSLLESNGVNTDMLLFVDVEPAFEGEPAAENTRCISIKSLDIDELVKAIHTSIPKMKSRRKFIFIDSMTTIALYKPLSEVMRFSEFLIRIAKKNGEDVLVVFNVAKDLAQKEFIKGVSMQADDVIDVSGKSSGEG